MPTFRSAIGNLVLEEEGSGPTLLCLHGLGGGAWFFQGLAQRLKERFRVVTLDLPGTGVNRAGATPFSMARCVESLAAILKEEESEPVSLLGHSMGTLIALLAYAEVPQRVRSLLFIGGLPAVTDTIRKRLAGRRAEILALGMEGLGRKAARGVFSAVTLRQDPEIAALYARLWEINPPAAYLEGIDALLGASAEHAVAKVRIPSLVLTGSEDEYAPPAAARRFAAALAGPVRYVEMAECGHMTFLESPDRFSHEIADFLECF